MLLPRLLPREDRSWAVKLLIIGFGLKMFGAIARLWIAEGVYGYGDSLGYADEGTRIAALIREGRWSEIPSFTEGSTVFVDFVTGVFFAIVGSSTWGGFLLFSLLSLLGLLLFYRAFRIAFPSANKKLALLILLFHPTMVYWSSAIGKDALVVLGTGIATYGLALQIAQGRSRGLLLFLAGAVLVFVVRAPTGLILLAAAGPALVLSRPAPNPLGWTTKLVVILLIPVALTAVFTVGARLLEVDALDVDVVIERFDEESNRDYDESGAGSNFEVRSIYDPLWIPSAITTVFVRPFPWETSNLQALLQSFDGVLTGGLILFASWRVLRNGVALENRWMIVFLVATVFGLVLILGTLGNFGLLARQRATLLPFLLLLLALPRASRWRPYGFGYGSGPAGIAFQRSTEVDPGRAH